MPRMPREEVESFLASAKNSRIFEFEHNFDKDDLTHIWQNLPPKSVDKVEEREVTIRHELLSDELLGTEGMPSQLKWMVFKVKKKAVKNYFSKVSAGVPECTLATPGCTLVRPERILVATESTSGGSATSVTRLHSGGTKVHSGGTRTHSGDT